MYGSVPSYCASATLQEPSDYHKETQFPNFRIREYYNIGGDDTPHITTAIPGAWIGSNGRASLDPYNKVRRVCDAVNNILIMLSASDRQYQSFLREYLNILRRVVAYVPMRDQDSQGPLHAAYEDPLLRMRQLLANVPDPERFIFKRDDIETVLSGQTGVDYTNERYVRVTILPLIYLLQCAYVRLFANKAHALRVFYLTLDTEVILRFAPAPVIDVHMRESYATSKTSLQKRFGANNATLRRMIRDGTLNFEVAIYVIRARGLGLDLPTRSDREWVLSARGLFERPAERMGVLIEKDLNAQRAGSDSIPTTAQAEDGA